jgi:hypothetical protein
MAALYNVFRLVVKPLFFIFLNLSPPLIPQALAAKCSPNVKRVIVFSYVNAVDPLEFTCKCQFWYGRRVAGPNQTLDAAPVRASA